MGSGYQLTDVESIFCGLQSKTPVIIINAVWEQLTRLILDASNKRSSCLKNVRRG